MEQRSNKRQRTILEGRIVFNNRFSLIECRVRDLSDTGARIMFEHPVTIPPEFEFEIPSRELSVWARVMWSNGREHGIRFTEGPQANLSSGVSTSVETEQPQDTSVPEKTLADYAKLQEILDEAQRRIAQITGVPADNIRLKLDVDVAGTGTTKK
ncbi:PilZ domain-containing protein [Microvirga vignae]|uniref:PilZ domain-containing protein n=1 Tax=Microvirga vignae TaxID=1225564 RepID=UPI00069CA1EA|nr:PilZ domain-containing protein [Microvirga vignae]